MLALQQQALNPFGGFTQSDFWRGLLNLAVSNQYNHIPQRTPWDDINKIREYKEKFHNWMIPNRYVNSGTPDYFRMPRKNFILKKQNYKKKYSSNQITDLNPELKAFDVSIGSTSCNTTGSVTLLNNISLGSDRNNRVGNRIVLKSCLIRLNYKNGSSIVGTNARILLVYDKQANGATATITNVLTAIATTAPTNLDTADRFLILMDSYVDLQPGGSALGGYGNFKRIIKMSLDTVYDLNNNITTGTLLLLLMGDFTSGSNQGILVEGNVRVRYYDD